MPTATKVGRKRDINKLRREFAQHEACQAQTIGNQGKDGRKSFPRGQFFPTKNRQHFPLFGSLSLKHAQPTQSQSFPRNRSIFHAKCFPMQFSPAFPRADCVMACDIASGLHSQLDGCFPAFCPISAVLIENRVHTQWAIPPRNPAFPPCLRYAPRRIVGFLPAYLPLLLDSAHSYANLDARHLSTISN